MNRVLRRCRDDEGSALAAVMGLMAVVALASIAVVSTSVSANSSATTARAGVESEAAANAGIDAVTVLLNAHQFPCADVQSTAPIYTVKISYFTSAGASMNCVSGMSPASATLKSTGTAVAKGAWANGGDTSVVLAKVTITTPQSGAVFQHAVFSNGDFSMANNTTIGSAVGSNDGSVYTNGNIGCSGNVTIQGPVVAPKGTVTFHNPCSSTGTVADRTSGAPVEQFPRIDAANSGVWAAAGWTVASVTCAAATTYLTNSWPGGSLLLITDCSTVLPLSTLALKGNLAIMSPGGFSGSGLTVTTTGNYSLEWIVPSDSPSFSWPSTQPDPPATCSSNISLAQQTSIDPRVSLLLYTPCSITVDNNTGGGGNSSFRGQVYGSSVSFSNHTGVTLAKVSVPGASYGTSPVVVVPGASLTSRFDAR